MAKLNIKKSLYSKIEGFEKKEIIRDIKHQELVNEANEKIRIEQIKKEKAYENAKNYLID